MSDRIRVGIIGANPNGSWGTRAHLPALAALDEFSIAAVATSHQETAEATARQFGATRAFGDPRRLVESADVDVVSVCVRVPAHFELVRMALDAGKHVYCEWPLARNVDEAAELCRLADGKPVITMIGLQARHAPVLNHVRDLLAAGEIGRVLACSLNHSVDWMPVLPSSLTYLQDFASGAHMLSIPGGHSIDALRWLLGDFHELSALVATQVPAITVVDRGDTFPRTSPDQVLLSAVTASGVMASARIQGGSPHGTGVSLEINGDKGDLLIRAEAGGRGIQMSDLHLYKTTGSAQLEPVTVPEHYFAVPDSIRANPPLNVAKSYQALARAIRDGEKVPDFHDALALHKLLDDVVRSSRERTFIG
ncbi:MAG: Gfo/Idh/MocA family oxidoreductase [Porticoccaceae bacterium]